MKMHTVIRLSVLMAAVTFAGCRSTNRLAQYDFYQATIAADAPFAVPPDVYTDLAWRTDGREGDSVVDRVLRVGSAVIKEVGAEEARKKLRNWQPDVASGR